MNVSYKIVWNPSTGTWVVASEFAKNYKSGVRINRAARISVASVALAGVIGSTQAGGIDQGDIGQEVSPAAASSTHSGEDFALTVPAAPSETLSTRTASAQ